MADVRQSRLIKEDLLDDENRDGFGQLRASLHDAQAEGDDLGGEKEVDDCGVVVLLDESANHAQRREPEVFKGASFGGSV